MKWEIVGVLILVVIVAAFLLRRGPDLVLDPIAYSPDSPTVGTVVTITAPGRNQGTAGAGPFVVRLHRGGTVQDQEVASLASGALTSVTFTVRLLKNQGTFTTVADATGQVAESNETNNQRHVTVGGPVVQSDIAVEGATSQWRTHLKTSIDLGSVALSVRPRIMLHHAATCYRTPVELTATLPAVAAVVRPRLTFHYAATAAHAGLVLSPEVVRVAQVRPRLVIEGVAASHIQQDLRGSTGLVEEASRVGPRIVLQGAPFGKPESLLGPPWEGEMPAR